jgi:hypothetical protein
VEGAAVCLCLGVSVGSSCVIFPPFLGDAELTAGRNLIGFAASTSGRMRGFFVADVVRCAFSYGCYQMEVFQGECHVPSLLSAFRPPKKLTNEVVPQECSRTFSISGMPLQDARWPWRVMSWPRTRGCFRLWAWFSLILASLRLGCWFVCTEYCVWCWEWWLLARSIKTRFASLIQC